MMLGHVVAGLALITPAWEEVHQDVTRVTFRELTPRDVAWYVASGEWEGCRPRLTTITTRLDPADQSETDPRISLIRSVVTSLVIRSRLQLRPCRQKAVRHVMPQRDQELARHGNNGDPPDFAVLVTNTVTEPTT